MQVEKSWYVQDWSIIVYKYCFLHTVSCPYTSSLVSSVGLRGALSPARVGDELPLPPLGTGVMSSAPSPFIVVELLLPPS